ncbi:RDD family protein [Microbulbifer pacificus]|uniref:RDD family protein n=1 Tax=Microbulbifer pacificus TaxID=407164 RepID=UPI000CF3780C|nr:RDD family protein [Microbulbifer pacificus]
MNSWAILGIEPCDDPRAIKRAYAIKLKQNRPDERPEAFQQLHSAYKQALRLAQASAERRQRNTAELVDPVPEVLAAEESSTVAASSEMPPSGTLGEITAVSAPVGEDADSAPNRESEASVSVVTKADDDEASTEEDAARQLRIEEYHRVLALVEQALQDPLRVNLENRWHFLVESPYMLEDEYNWNLGLAVFERFARFNLAAAEAKGKGKEKYRTVITDNVLAYCDQLFGWSGAVETYYARFGKELADILFDALQTDPRDADPASAIRGGSKLVRQKARVLQERLEQYFFGGLLGRAVAVILDIGLVHLMVGVLATAVIMKVTGQTESDATFSGLLFSGSVYLLLSWLAECSQWQTTPGKWLLGYRVMDRDFQRVGYLRGLWRTASFLLTVPTLKIGWFINCFLGGNLLHDRMSRTYVVNYRKSREEHLRRHG